MGLCFYLLHSARPLNPQPLSGTQWPSVPLRAPEFQPEFLTMLSTLPCSYQCGLSLMFYLAFGTGMPGLNSQGTIIVNLCTQTGESLFFRMRQSAVSTMPSQVHRNGFSGRDPVLALQPVLGPASQWGPHLPVLFLLLIIVLALSLITASSCCPLVSRDEQHLCLQGTLFSPPPWQRLPSRCLS